MDNARELAYFAGLVDGEGCITIKRCATFTRRKRSPTYIFSLCLEMADPRPIQAFCDYFGLTMHHNTSRHLKDPERHRFLYVAQIGRNKGIAILQALLPYLRAKREEAEVAIEFYQRCYVAHNHLAAGRNRAPVPPELLELRHDYYLTLQALKRRRWPVESLPGAPRVLNAQKAY